ncbi:MAG TPA: hypothetical protein VNG69_03630 [Casimicrobiaceae bacterium]|nr:hypothetical protein [Casimicrobiaceae bacterium]
MHFEIYESSARAVSGANAVRTSQLALPEAANREVYAQSSLYPGSLANLNRMPLARDGTFADDGGVTQLAATNGNVASGYVSTLSVGVTR